MKVGPRVDYDRIAVQYDTQPYRQKTVDPELVAFLAQRQSDRPIRVLDVGCGTGNQLVANRTVYPAIRMVGVDRFHGMLRQAQPKAPAMAWVQADGTALPFQAQAFDFVTCQYALHHILDKTAMVQAVFRVLRPGGRFILTNICPHAMPDWLYYAYFPSAHAIDLRDFWPPETIKHVMECCGFQGIEVELVHHRYTQDLRAFLATVRRRDACSQLVTLPDDAYAAGVQRLEREVQGAAGPCQRPDHVCVLTMRGEKR
jgi:ubiquinone/menaquinone biosynthesis C-methylase UbiE